MKVTKFKTGQKEFEVLTVSIKQGELVLAHRKTSNTSKYQTAKTAVHQPATPFNYAGNSRL
jgi:hypothetical protein